MKETTMLTAAARSELIKLRAYRTTYALPPLVALMMAGGAAFGFDATRNSAASGAAPAELIDSAAFAFGSGSLLSGLCLGIFGAIIVTTDLGSGTVNQSLQVLPRRSILLAKVVVGGLFATIATMVGVLVASALGLVMLPSAVNAGLVTSAALWTNLGGTLASHLTWTSMGIGFGFLMKRQAPAMGATLLIMLGLPAAGAVLVFTGQAQRWLEYLPAGLMQAATATGAGSALSLGPLAATAALLIWCCLFVGGGWLMFRRQA